jgi:hypothetical protein
MTNEDVRSADYYQEHKDDDSEWGEPERAPASKSRRLASMISARFASSEVESIREAAMAEGTSVSQFIRLAALARAGQAQPSLRWRIGETYTGSSGDELPRRGSRSGYVAELGGKLMPLALQRA